MESRAENRGEVGFWEGLSQQARRDLIILGIFVAIGTLLQLLIPNGGWWEAMDTFVNNQGGEIDVIVPFAIMGAVGFGFYAFRRLQELQAMNAARERARAAAGQAQQQVEQAQRETQQARQEAEQLQSQMLNTSMNVLVKVDSEGKVLQANEGMEIATGLPGSSLVGQEAFSFFGDSEKAQELFNRSLAGESVSDSETQLVHQDGGMTSVSYSAMAQRNLQGEVIGGILLLRPREEALT